MLNFTYHNPTKLIFGKDSIAELKNLINPESKILFLYGGGSIKKNGVYDQVISSLSSDKTFEFGGVEPNPSYTTLIKAIELVKKENIDFILAVGGGSVIDGAKFVAAGAKYAGDPWDFIIGKAEIKQALPIGAILTIPATGSESNGNSVISKYETGEKRAFSSPLVYPQFAILDPETMKTLPTRQLINGIADAFTHVMEQYLTYNIGGDEVQERQAEALLITLKEVAPRVLGSSPSYDDYSTLMWAANQALNMLIGRGVPQDWSTHMIGHELTSKYGLDHAQALMVVLPRVMEYKKDTKRAKLIKYATRVCESKLTDEDALVEFAITDTKNFFKNLGANIDLADYGISDTSEIAEIAKEIFEKRQSKLGENQDILPEDVANILKMC